MANPRKTIGEQMIEIELSTIVSRITKLGMVNFKMSQGDKEFETQWDIRKAKEVRDMISEAIEAAISDTIILKYLLEIIELDEQKALMALVHFREIRQGLRGTVYPS